MSNELNKRLEAAPEGYEKSEYLFQTNNNGNIVAISDGKTITVKPEKQN